MRMNHVVLIGMPGTGKSTIGIRLAKRLQYRFVDTDQALEQQEGKPLPAILRERGVQGFLALEGALGAALPCEGCVIATGGSMVWSEPAMRHLAADGLVLWLDTPLAELRRRIARHADRGIAAEPGTSLQEIEQQRRPLYERYATVRIECTGRVGQVLERIEQAMAAEARRAGER